MFLFSLRQYVCIFGATNSAISGKLVTPLSFRKPAGAVLVTSTHEGRKDARCTRARARCAHILVDAQVENERRGCQMHAR